MLSAKLEAAMTDLQADVRACLDLLKAQIPALNAAIATLEAEVATLTGDKTAAEAALADLHTQVDATEQEVLSRIQATDTLLEAELPPPTP